MIKTQLNCRDSGFVQPAGPGNVAPRRASPLTLVQACGLAPGESFDEDDLYDAMDELSGQ